MKYYISFLLICLCNCLCIESIAQKNFTEGFYINKYGDTTRGYISINNSNHPDFFKFKSLNDDIISIVSFDSCKELSYADNHFVNWYGIRSLTYVDKISFNIEKLGDSVLGKIPLKLLYKGSRLSLYYYRDITDHFFVGYESSIQELRIAYRYLTDWEKLQYTLNPPNYLITPVYRYQLISLMDDQLTKKQKYLVEETEYDKRSLTKLFKSLDKSRKK